MAEDDPLHYLPPGWTEEKYANATEADFESLPDEVRQLALCNPLRSTLHTDRS